MKTWLDRSCVERVRGEHGTYTEGRDSDSCILGAVDVQPCEAEAGPCLDCSRLFIRSLVMML